MCPMHGEQQQRDLIDLHAQGSSTSDSCSSSEAVGAYNAVKGDNGSSNSRDGNRSKQKCGDASRHEATDQQKNGSKPLQQTA